MTMGIDAVRGLIQRFQTHQEEYTSPAYNEALLRQDFLNPFFEALGWDIANKRGWSETFREVVHEDALMVEGLPNTEKLYQEDPDLA